MLQDYSEVYYKRTYSFTTEIHTFFTYTGINQTFAFSGDDDLWVFVNNKLAVDVGGAHDRSEAQVDLSDPYVANYLGLKNGSIYPLDLFNAERHSYGSNFEITTSLTFECSILNSGQPVYTWNPGNFTSDWKLVGGLHAATVQNQSIQLTSSLEPNLASYVFLQQKVNIGPGFVINFAFTASSQGLGFVFGLLSQTITNLNGGSGPSLGFRNMNASWAIAFDFCTDWMLNTSFPPCNAREIRMNYLDLPTSPNNVSSSTRRLFSTLYMPNTLNDGFSHNIMIRQFGTRPPWIEVYIDNSLYLQQRNISLVDVLDSEDAWVGFTASTGLTPAERSDIFITDFSVVAVAIADQKTQPYNLPNGTQSAVADGHHFLSFSVQNFDLCGNRITFGGYSDRAYGFLSVNSPSAAPTTVSPSTPTASPSTSPTPPVLSGRALHNKADRVAEEGDDVAERHSMDSVRGDIEVEPRRLVNSVQAPPNFTVIGDVVDNGDGTYSFVFNTTDTGLYDLHMYFGTQCFVNGSVANGLDPVQSHNQSVCFSYSANGVAEFLPTTPAPTYGSDAPPTALGSAALSGIGVAAGVISAVGCFLIIVGIRVRNRWRKDKEFIEAGRIAAAERGVQYLGDNELDRLQHQLQKTLEEIQKERARKAGPEDQQDAIRALLRQKGELQETVRQLKIRAQGGDPNAPAGDRLSRVRKSFTAASRFRVSANANRLSMFRPSTGGEEDTKDLREASQVSDNPLYVRERNSVFRNPFAHHSETSSSAKTAPKDVMARPVQGSVSDVPMP